MKLLLACLALVVFTCMAETQEPVEKAKLCKKMCRKPKHSSISWEAKCKWKKCGGCSECTNPCDKFEGSFAYSPHEISAGLLDVMSKDEKIVKANACNVCPKEGTLPVWIAPGDICTLKDMPEAHFDHCKTTEWADDYNVTDHVKACLTMPQIDDLWLTGHCHNTTSTLPFVGKQGLLYCCGDSYCIPEMISHIE